MKVAIFCGGSGSRTIIKELVNRGHDVALLINGYDDGKSTGLLRKLIPGMLGPSDFRKNFALLTPIPEVKQALDYRFPDDTSLGNLIFAGAYLAHKQDFNKTVKYLIDLFQIPVKIVNVGTKVGQLIAVKEDGTFLLSETKIVAPQNSSPITDLYLLPESDSISVEAGRALEQADIIVYGPGTQFSSLFPSYKVKGVSELIKENTCNKVFIVNLAQDNDTQGWTGEQLLDKALYMLKDPYNYSQVITHVLAPKGVVGQYRNTVVIEDNFDAPCGVHDGVKVVDRLEELC